MARKLKTTNRHGITIVKCCASCAFNMGMSSEKTRICQIGEGIVKPSSYCGTWKMRKGLDNAGFGGGRVKKRKYLYFALNFESSPEQPATVNEKRAAYMEKFGSIYINK